MGKDTFTTAKQSLEELGYCMIQYKGDASPISTRQLHELDRLGTRVQGFDSMFKTPVFSTITYVRDLDGLMRFLSLDMCKRYIHSTEVVSHTHSNGIIYANTPHVLVYVNTNHEHIDKFKRNFIGKGGERIQQLNKKLDCVISLKNMEDKPVETTEVTSEV